jgi:diguanylate cyclase (GGDEF)-like protein
MHVNMQLLRKAAAYFAVALTTASLIKTVLGSLATIVVIWLAHRFGQALDMFVSPMSLATAAPIMSALLVLASLLGYFNYKKWRAGGETAALKLQYGHFDYLTKLPNRLLLNDRLSTLAARARRDGAVIALHLVDLDQFKRVNDELGHRAGDRLLTLVADRLIETCREIDTVARLGGDEFVILQLIGEATEAHALGDRVIQAISSPFHLTDRDIRIGCSIGLVTSTGYNTELESLLEAADGALYLSKKSGGNVLNVASGRPTHFMPESFEQARPPQLAVVKA